ncbi:hypothetical protein [Metabacillus indicus]|uniref:hypothetical protein n=1 Tax=Metabacillus indicus TaxID=246786 RepID=UPI000691153F|nr:hypothetical protein [Metabacillus indicus]
MNKKQWLIVSSLILTVFLSFIPGIGYREEGNYRFFGVPAQWLGYYGDGQISFEIWGFLLNVGIMYWLLFGVNKLVSGRFSWR